jgi:hypothetical protein
MRLRVPAAHQPKPFFIAPPDKHLRISLDVFSTVDQATIYPFILRYGVGSFAARCSEFHGNGCG